MTRDGLNRTDIPVPMRIGQLAARAGVNPKTIRFYEERGLLPTPLRTSAGYRTYGDEDLARLRFVKSAQRLGLRLNEIGEILAFKEQGARPCDYVIQLLGRRIDEIDRHLAELQQLRDDLETLKAEADRLPAAGANFCRIIEHGVRAR